jgi:hypothetical protein
MAVADECARRGLCDFDSMSMSVIVVGLGMFGVRHDPFFTEVVRESLARGLHKFGHSHLTVMRWTFSHYPVQYTEFIASINQEMLRRGITDEVMGDGA